MGWVVRPGHLINRQGVFLRMVYYYVEFFSCALA
jgi:hypothetical protein